MQLTPKPKLVGDYGLEPADLMEVGRNRVFRVQPYYEKLLHKLKLVERPHHGGISVDAGLRLYYDPELAVKWGVTYLPTFCAHEVQHPLRMHEPRGRALGVSYRARYEGAVAGWLAQTYHILSFTDLLNWAADIEINQDVNRAGFTWPPDFTPCTPELFDFPPDESFEDYVRRFIERAEEALEETKQTPASGTGSGPGGEGECDDEGKGEDAVAADSGQSPVGHRRGGQRGSGGGGQPSGGERAEGRGEAHPGTPERDAGGAGPAENQEGEEQEKATDPRVADGAGAGAGCCGGCCGNPVHGEGEDEASLPEPVAPDDKELTLVSVAQDVLDWLAQREAGEGRGVAPGGWLVGWARSMFQAPRLNPYAILSRLIRGAVGRAQEYQRAEYGKVSRRRETLVRMGWGREAPLTPNYRAPQPRVVFAVDTSGSMGAGEKSRLNDALREAWGFCSAAHGNVYGIAVDSDVHEAREIRSQSDLVALAQGGGGTDMRVGIAAMANPALKADVMVLLTDGETPWPTAQETPHNVPLVVVIVNDNKYYFEKLPKHLRGRAVYLGREERP